MKNLALLSRRRCRRARLGLLGMMLSYMAAMPGTFALAGQGPDGRDIYNFRCYFCHGYSGDARTLAAEMLQPRPRDFTATPLEQLSRDRMIEVIRGGIDGTAMKPFASLLNDAEIGAVADFVRDEFMRRGAVNTRYHTVANGWPEHDRFAIAYPFVRGEISLAADDAELTPTQRQGRALYVSACISCHDLARSGSEKPTWEAEAVSYPRVGFATGDFLEPPDAVSGATTFAKHDIAPRIPDLSPAEARGEALFQSNCAFCHAADGTGKNWIGTFMKPHPRDLTSDGAMQHMTRSRLAAVIREGLPGTSMPAWGAVLDMAQIHDIVAYIGKAFYPSLRDR